jgi:hypothetical protein
VADTGLRVGFGAEVAEVVGEDVGIVYRTIEFERFRSLLLFCPL